MYVCVRERETESACVYERERERKSGPRLADDAHLGGEAGFNISSAAYLVTQNMDLEYGQRRCV